VEFVAGISNKMQKIEFGRKKLVGPRPEVIFF
jgi:hypothetical protein